MDYQSILYRISEGYKNILKSKLVGIYVHGSIAFGCFNPNKSDIDFLVVVRDLPTLDEKEKLIKLLLELNYEAPSKGFEMSVVELDVCKNFVYPTRCELHFSNAHLRRYQENLRAYCEVMNGPDKDLAAHFTVIRKVGIVLCGQEIDRVFGEVPKEYYLDSIKTDVEHAKDDVCENPVYIVLNLCRVLAYMSEELILSKEQGGLWGVEHLPPRFAELIRAALNVYRSDYPAIFDERLLYEFCDDMSSRIFA